MTTHELKIGQRIWDCHDERWGEVLLIGGEDRDETVNGEDDQMIVLYRTEGGGECETWAEDAYPLIPGKLYDGEAVCLEINNMEDACDRFDYYCPARDENCQECETVSL